MKPRKIISIAFYGSSAFMLVMMLIHGEYVTQPAKEALSFCGNILIPSLFTYMVLSSILMESPLVARAERYLGYGAMIFILGILCGAPVGAKISSQLYHTGRISKKRAEYYAAFTNNAGVSFVVGCVGREMLFSTRVGVKLVLFQIISSLIAALALKFIMGENKKEPPCLGMTPSKSGLAEIISECAVAMINICACAIFFTVLASVITKIFGLSPFNETLLRSFLEFSSGCAAATRLNNYAFQMVALSIGFTGCSVALQVKKLLGKSLSVRPYLVGKLISCAVMIILAVIFG